MTRSSESFMSAITSRSAPGLVGDMGQFLAAPAIQLFPLCVARFELPLERSRCGGASPLGQLQIVAGVSVVTAPRCFRTTWSPFLDDQAVVTVLFRPVARGGCTLWYSCSRCSRTLENAFIAPTVETARLVFSIAVTCRRSAAVICRYYVLTFSAGRRSAA